MQLQKLSLILNFQLKFSRIYMELMPYQCRLAALEKLQYDEPYCNNVVWIHFKTKTSKNISLKHIFPNFRNLPKKHNLEIK